MLATLLSVHGPRVQFEEVLVVVRSREIGGPKHRASLELGQKRDATLEPSAKRIEEG